MPRRGALKGSLDGCLQGSVLKESRSLLSLLEVSGLRGCRKGSLLKHYIGAYVCLRRPHKLRQS